MVPTSTLHSTRAITLVEILVVVVIIGVLASLVIPSLSKASASAIRTKCLGNLRQSGMALRQYALTNAYHLPHCTRRPSNPPIGEEDLPGIAETIGSFLDNREVFRCPADNGTFADPEGTSYEWNSLLNGKQVGHEKLEILDVEVEVPLMADYEQFHLGAGKPGKNFLYADGSVDFNLR